MKKKALKVSMISVVGVAVLLLGGCGHVSSAKKLIRLARAEHGKCEVISQKEEAEYTEVVLMDELQGFTYTVSSSMYEMNIDGSSFGSYPQTRDRFQNALCEYVLQQSSSEIEALSEKTGASIDDNFYLTIPVGADPAALGKAYCSILAKQNLEGRMDRFRIWIEDEKGNLQGCCHISDGTFLTPEEEEEAREAEELQEAKEKKKGLHFHLHLGG